MTKKVIIGLRNPGKEYEKTRHNIGGVVVKALALESMGSVKWKRGKKAEFLEGEIEGEKAVFVLPTTYMNCSGEAAAEIVRRFGADAEDFLLVYDDMDIPFGQIRLKKGGGDSGHNGVKSVINALGSDDFYRLRIGIGKPPVYFKEGKDWVLGKFSRAEQEVLDNIVQEAKEALKVFYREGLASAQQKYNKKDLVVLKDREQREKE